MNFVNLSRSFEQKQVWSKIYQKLTFFTKQSPKNYKQKNVSHRIKKASNMCFYNKFLISDPKTGIEWVPDVLAPQGPVFLAGNFCGSTFLKFSFSQVIFMGIRIACRSLK